MQIPEMTARTTLKKQINSITVEIIENVACKRTEQNVIDIAVRIMPICEPEMPFCAQYTGIIGTAA
jgi:hypothetical protein